MPCMTYCSEAFWPAVPATETAQVPVPAVGTAASHFLHLSSVWVITALLLQYASTALNPSPCADLHQFPSFCLTLWL